MTFPKTIKIRADQKKLIWIATEMMLINHGSVKLEVEGGASAMNYPQQLIILKS